VGSDTAFGRSYGISFSRPVVVIPADPGRLNGGMGENLKMRLTEWWWSFAWRLFSC
jgi:hypothetical protein